MQTLTNLTTCYNLLTYNVWLKSELQHNQQQKNVAPTRRAVEINKYVKILMLKSIVEWLILERYLLLYLI